MSLTFLSAGSRGSSSGSSKERFLIWNIRSPQYEHGVHLLNVEDYADGTVFGEVESVFGAMKSAPLLEPGDNLTLFPEELKGSLEVTEKEFYDRFFHR